eukprot:COSAG01_NODE_44637_length_417_cov_0.628931_1_plen_82_part_10
MAERIEEPPLLAALLQAAPRHGATRGRGCTSREVENVRMCARAWLLLPLWGCRRWRARPLWRGGGGVRGGPSGPAVQPCRGG